MGARTKANLIIPAKELITRSMRHSAASLEQAGIQFIDADDSAARVCGCAGARL
jgi:hypothetical protein